MKISRFDMQDVLALDSLENFLSQSDRISCHKAIRLGAISTEVLPIKVKEALKLIKNHNWQPPERKYEPDRILRYWDDEAESYRMMKHYHHVILDKVKQITN